MGIITSPGEAKPSATWDADALYQSIRQAVARYAGVPAPALDPKHLLEAVAFTMADIVVRHRELRRADLADAVGFTMQVLRTHPSNNVATETKEGESQ